MPLGNRSLLASFQVFLVIFLGLGHIAFAAVSNLPACATACAVTAAGAIGCKLTNADTSCLCAHPFFSAATSHCIQNSDCSPVDRSKALGILDSLCGALLPRSVSSTTSSNISSTHPHPSTSPTSSGHSTSTNSTSSHHSTTTSKSSTISHSTTTSTPKPSPTLSSSVTETGSPTSSGTVVPSTSPAVSFSQTSVVVQSVTSPLPTTSNPPTSGAVGAGDFMGKEMALKLLVGVGWVFGGLIVLV